MLKISPNLSAHFPMGNSMCLPRPKTFPKKGSPGGPKGNSNLFNLSNLFQVVSLQVLLTNLVGGSYELA